LLLLIARPTPRRSPSSPPARATPNNSPLLCERSLLQRADGSAKWVQDGSAVLAAVSGPAAAGPRRENSERAVVEVVFKPCSGLAGSREREWEEVLRETVGGVLLAALHPRTLVTVVVQVLQADGALLSCAVNAACAALVDAGVPLTSLFGAFFSGAALVGSGRASLSTSAVGNWWLPLPRCGPAAPQSATHQT
jgi:ribonuclease PH